MVASQIATQVVVNHRHQQQQQQQHQQQRDQSAEHLAGIDGDGDGKLSRKEFKAAMSKIAVRADRMKRRLDLEEELVGLCFKLPNFVICMACFLAALCEFMPPGATHNIHRHIEHHFHLGGLPNIKSFEAVYEYMEFFEKQNEKMQATSTKFWCEDRYSEHKWDDHLMVPVWECKSPRQYALSLSSDSSSRWAVLNGYASSSSGSGSSSGSSSSGSSRRLGGSSGGSGSGSGTIQAVRPNPPCLDNDTMLQLEEADATITCNNSAAHICEIDLGITLCPLTCGYCAPFTYQHIKKFEKPQVTMLPVMLYQTRFGAIECHGFAHEYEIQPYNPVLTLLPALDGRRHGRVLTCIDRDIHYEEEYALELECPAHGPSTHCHNGKAKFTEKHEFHGVPIYPRLLIEPHRDILALKAIEWLDLQTETVTVSTMVYTEGVEVFTSLSVEFYVDEAGNVDAAPSLVSYRDMINGSKFNFIVCLSLCSAFGFIGVLCTTWYAYQHFDECKWEHTIFEMFTRLTFFIYPIILLVSWSQQVPMAVEYDHILHSLLDLPGMDHDSLEEGITAYFDAKTHLYSETTWLLTHRIVAYIILYVQFLQLVLYFDAHPKMALITDTVSMASSSIIHFLMLFGTLFVMLGFMAHWMLGEQIPRFGTFSETIQTQVMMFIGEFIQAGGVDELDGMMMAMYWIYAGTFLLLVWLTLLNFFLAIIVDAFVVVKEEFSKNVVVGNFLPDVCGMLWTEILWRKWKWPSKNDLEEYFGNVAAEAAAATAEQGCPKWMAELQGEDPEEEEEEGSNVPMATPEAILQAFPGAFTEDSLTAFIYHYFHKTPAVLCANLQQGDTKPTDGSDRASSLPKESEVKEASV